MSVDPELFIPEGDIEGYCDLTTGLCVHPSAVPVNESEPKEDSDHEGSHRD